MATTQGGVAITRKMTDSAANTKLTQSSLYSYLSAPAMLTQFENALPLTQKGQAASYVRDLLTCCSDTPKLLYCDRTKLGIELLKAMSLGLKLSPALGQAYMIPYENTKRTQDGDQSVFEPHLQLGYRGIAALLWRSGLIENLKVDVVHEKDDFEYIEALRPEDSIFRHKAANVEDPGPVTFFYAKAAIRGGGYAIEVWPVNKVRAHGKKFSKSFENGPWKDHFESMGKKTVLIALAKWLPLSADIFSTSLPNEDGTPSNTNYVPSEFEANSNTETIQVEVVENASETASA